MKKKKMMLILVLLLAIGFASVSTTLIITGVVGVSSKKQYEGPVKEALYGENRYEKHIQKTISNATLRLIEKTELEALGCSSTEYICTSSSVPSWVIRK